MLTCIALVVTAAMSAQGSRAAENGLPGALTDGLAAESTAETNGAAALTASAEVSAGTDLTRTGLFANHFAEVTTRAVCTSQQGRLFDGIVLPVAPVCRSDGAQAATQGHPASQNRAASRASTPQDDDSLIDANTGGSSSSEAR